MPVPDKYPIPSGPITWRSAMDDASSRAQRFTRRASNVPGAFTPLALLIASVRVFGRRLWMFLLPSLAYEVLSQYAAGMVFADVFTLTFVGPPAGLVAALLMLLVYLVGIVLAGGLSYLAVEVQQYDSSSLAEALSEGAGKSLSLMAAQILASLCVGLPMLPFALLLLPPVLSWSAVFTWLMIPFLVMVVPIAIWIGLGFALTPPAIVAEGLGPIDGMARSWHLTRGKRGPLFLVVFLIEGLAVVLTVLALPLLMFGDWVLLLASVLVGAVLFGLSAAVVGTAYALVVPAPPRVSPLSNPWLRQGPSPE